MKHNAPRTALFWIFALSSIWEGAMTVSFFTNPEFEANQFHGPMNAQTVFFSNILGGFMILFSSLCVYCAWLLRERNPAGRTLALMIGVFWVYMGAGLYLHPGAPAYVLGDSVRGFVIIVLACLLDSQKTSLNAAARL